MHARRRPWRVTYTHTVGVRRNGAAHGAHQWPPVAHGGFEISVSRTQSEEDSVSIWYKLRAVCMYVRMCAEKRSRVSESTKSE